MTTLTVLGAAIAAFLIAALLVWQSQQQGLTEGFRALPPIAGRPYNAGPDKEDPYFVPGDLAKAPVTQSASAVPTVATRPAAIPGPGAAPRDLPATQKDLQELDMRITSWLEAMDQLENEHPGWITPEQKHQRIVYQARLSSLRDQMGTGMITDTARVISQEIADMRRENQVWKSRFPNLEELSTFGLGRPAEAFLEADEYREFRALFDAVVNELKGHPQPDPLERVRFQQLQIVRQDLLTAETAGAGRPPPIRIGAARLFLTQALKPDQPLPTLFAMEANPATEPPKHAESTADIIAALQDVEWTLTISHNPAEQELKQAVAKMLRDVRARGPTMNVDQVAALRAQVAGLRTARAPAAMIAPMAGLPPAVPGAPWPTANSMMRADYNPSDLVSRARTLCTQVREAFGDGDAEALGCPPKRWQTKAIETEYEAETVLNTVCDRLRTSVPSVDPAQFNCPRHAV
jgi:hypothetical protein